MPETACFKQTLDTNINPQRFSFKPKNTKNWGRCIYLKFSTMLHEHQRMHKTQKDDAFNAQIEHNDSRASSALNSETRRF